jgi:hypothetical protein
MTLFTAAVFAVAIVAGWLAWALYKKNQDLKRRVAGLTRPRTAPVVPAPFVPAPAPPISAEQERAEFLDGQLEAVRRPDVTFRRRKVMNGGEFSVFRAALAVTGQPYPTGQFGFWIFPQVSLGQIIGTEGAHELEAEAYRAINSKRCDLLIADRSGIPIAVLEYQGAGHDIGSTATLRDEIKRTALERAGVRFIEIKHGATHADIQRIIRELLTTKTTQVEASWSYNGQ